MKVIDLYSGLGGWGAAFLDRGHDVLSVDIEPSFNPDIVSDIRDLFREDITDSGEWENPRSYFGFAAVQLFFGSVDTVLLGERQAQE